LTTLTDGVYDPLAAEYRTRLGDIKHYVATDHLDSPAYRSLTPDDLLDVVAERALGWDTERETGVVLHMVSAIAAAGRIGLTAIGDTLEEARRRYYDVKAAVDEAAGATPVPPAGVRQGPRVRCAESPAASSMMSANVGSPRERRDGAEQEPGEAREKPK